MQEHLQAISDTRAELEAALKAGNTQAAFEIHARLMSLYASLNVEELAKRAA